MPKNRNFIIIIITLESIEKIKTEKKKKQSEQSRERLQGECILCFLIANTQCIKGGLLGITKSCHLSFQTLNNTRNEKVLELIVQLLNGQFISAG